MIQRVQSIYLFLVVILMSFMLMGPLAELALKDGQAVIFHSYAIKKYLTNEHSNLILHTFPVLILICLAGLISFANIFLFHRRILQMRFCLLNILFMIGLLGLIFYYYFRVTSNLLIENHALKLPVVFPVVGIVLTLLAYRGINEDEVMVRSYDRLR
jgi:hypothetical protein